jgi:hypothetical protein
MKKFFIQSAILFWAVAGFAQGTVILNNRVGGVSHVWYSLSASAPVYGNASNDTPPGNTDYTGFTLIGTAGSFLGASTTFAQLLGAPGSNAPESGLLPSTSPPTTFRTGLGSGNIFAGTATFNNIAPDAPVASFELAVWDNSSGLYPTWTAASAAWSAGLILAGKSHEFVLQQIGGVVNTPPAIEPALQSFGIAYIPEPSVLSLLGVGLLSSFSMRRPYKKYKANS